MQTEIRAPGSSRRILLGASSLFLSCLLASGVAGAGAAAQSGTSRYIVQGPDAEVVAERIRALGGRVSSELPLINGVGAELTTAQARALGKDGALRLQADHAIQVASSRTSGQVFSNSLLHQVFQSVGEAYRFRKGYAHLEFEEVIGQIYLEYYYLL